MIRKAYEGSSAPLVAEDVSGKTHVPLVQIDGDMPLAQGASTLSEQQTQSTLLTQIRDAQVGNATPYTDDAATLFYRGAGGWVTARGSPYTPTGTVIVAGSSANLQFVQYRHVALVDSGNGYAVGDTLVHSVLIDVKTGMQVSQIWYNETTAVILATVGTADLEAAQDETAKLQTAIRDHQPGAPLEFEYIVWLGRDTAVNVLSANPQRRAVHLSLRADDPSAALNNNNYRVTLSTTASGSPESPHVMYHGGSTLLADALLSYVDLQMYSVDLDSWVSIREVISQ